MKFFSSSRTHFISHRGFTPLAPENSLPSFLHAGKFKQWAIETDLHLTKDGEVVCCHNDNILNYCGVDVKIADVNYKDLVKIPIINGNRVGCFTKEELKIPHLSEYLSICAKHGSIPFIELKTNDVERILFSLKKNGFDHKNTIISSINVDNLFDVRKFDKNMFLHWIFADESRLEEFANLKNAGISLNYPDAFACPINKIEDAKKLGLKICLRAADNVKTFEYMRQLKLDYFPTNCMHD